MKKLLTFISFLFVTGTISGQKNVIINGINKNDVRFYIGFQKVNEVFNYIQAAQKFDSSESGSSLVEVDIYRLIMNVNDGKSEVSEPASTTFFLKIYDVDSSTGSPGAQLNKEPIMVRSGSNSHIRVDLRKYKILVSGSRFFVGIEWIFNEKNLRLMQAKKAEVVKGNRYETAAPIYQPFLGMIKTNTTTSNVWVMTQDGKWKIYTQNMPYMTDLSITAHIVKS